MGARTTIVEAQPEGATTVIRATITDLDKVTPLASASSVVDAITMTLFEDGSKAIINACTTRNIKGTGGGTLYDTIQTDEDGVSYNLKVQLSAADCACITTKKSETHVALIEWEWGGASKKYGKHEVAWPVTNLAKVG